MSITGEGYIDSAKTAVGLIWRDFSLFYILERRWLTDFIWRYSIDCWTSNCYRLFSHEAFNKYF